MAWNLKNAKHNKTASPFFTPATYRVERDAAWYTGAGQAVAAISSTGEIFEAVYSGINVETADKARLAVKYPGAQIHAGQLSRYEFSLFS